MFKQIKTGRMCNVFEGIVSTKLGLIYIAFDAPTGELVAIVPGTDEKEIQQQVEDRYHFYRYGNLYSHEESVKEIIKSIETGCPCPISLATGGTYFQKKVWQELQSIPRGTTVDYKAVSENIGKPKAVRAVANACGANPIAIIIPCHRVVRSDGLLGGYRWGVEMKKHLLHYEGLSI